MPLLFFMWLALGLLPVATRRRPRSIIPTDPAQLSIVPVRADNGTSITTRGLPTAVGPITRPSTGTGDGTLVTGGGGLVDVTDPGETFNGTGGSDAEIGQGGGGGGGGGFLCFPEFCLPIWGGGKDWFAHYHQESKRAQCCKTGRQPDA